LESLAQGLLYFPVLSFKNESFHPEGAAIQVHGLVLQPISTTAERYQRVRYFWTADQDVIKGTFEQSGT
jgi:hypothetical protein